VGAGGVREDKVEGDAATPAGTFPLRRIYFRNDRLVLPKVGLPARRSTSIDGWCDDPRRRLQPAVRIPNDWSHEKMWREDGLYDLVVVVGYNDDPPEGEWGSAHLPPYRRRRLMHRRKAAWPSPRRPAGAGNAESDRRRAQRAIHPGRRNRTARNDETGHKQFEDFDESDW